MKKLGIALGGGGSRALCHLGVLTVLQDEGIPVHAVAGSSLGGLLAAMYAFEPDAHAVRRRAVQFFANSSLFGRIKKRKGDGLRGGDTGWGRVVKYFRTAAFFNVIAARNSLLKRNPVRKAIEALLPDADIRDAKKPLSCNALDLTSADPVSFRSGNVRHAVEAGTTVGMVFPPYRWEGRHYIDAAPVSSVPVYAARELGAEVVLAVDIRLPVEEMKRFHNGFDVVSRLEMVTSKILNEREVKSADVCIRPDVLDIFWGDFSDVESIVRAGEASASAALPQIRAALADAEESMSARAPRHQTEHHGVAARR